MFILNDTWSAMSRDYYQSRDIADLQGVKCHSLIKNFWSTRNFIWKNEEKNHVFIHKLAWFNQIVTLIIKNNKYMKKPLFWCIFCQGKQIPLSDNLNMKLDYQFYKFYNNNKLRNWTTYTISIFGLNFFYIIIINAIVKF